VLAVDITAPATGPADALVPLVADVRDRDALEAALAAALAPGSRIDAIANIAGIYPPTTLDTYDEATYRRIFDINVLGVLNVIAAARPYLGDGSAIVNFASVDAYEVSRGQLLYGASKAAVTMLTKSLALELAGAGIRVNGIAPGWVATPGNAATGRMDAAAASIPLGRVARPEEISAWVRILVDPASVAFMTGETVVLSGGDVIR
jgi:3-oxoacyl-[acyl-carrier protein] reductase